MELNEYEKRAMETCLPESDNPLYMLMELCEEVGELQGKFAKAIRHGAVWFDHNQMHGNLGPKEYFEFRNEVLKEVGDILWGVAGMCHVLGVPLDGVAKLNLEKLASRKNRGKIDGAGDNR